ncbi:hypothetical protein [Nonomuraea sp. SYSU D8015]|uniref:hypothetical protein n=1 Tax=Nonomuraea sp. SYSU D8015 TaxID=2593644 RepID=UPI001660280B|nr:hypothetical protein [Nonomuraea sp. SYSU D8015]
MPMPKLTPLEKMLQGKPYNRDHAAEVVAEFETLSGYAEIRRTQVQSLTETELPSLVEHAEALEELGGIFPQIAEHLTALANLTADLETIEEKLGEYIETTENFVGYATTWIDKEGDRETLAEAKDEMEGLASTLHDLQAELKELGLDVTVEA